MKNIRFYLRVMLMLGVTVSVLYWSNNYMAFNMACIVCLVFFLVNNALSQITRKEKVLYLIIYTIIMAFQIIANNFIYYFFANNEKFFLLYRIIGMVLILTPFFIKRILIKTGLVFLIYPYFNRFYSFTYSQIMKDKDIITGKIELVKRAGTSITREQINEIIQDMPRHSAFSYINNKSLSEEYFNKAYSTLNNGYMYIVISRTKSSASEIIGAFTNKLYNHVSLSFDEKLETIISYNGGGGVYSPGLNPEELEQLIKNEGASIIVYKLKANSEQKKTILEKVREINEVGSSYNITGVFQYSHKPNIMFCSQFVYLMLEIADLNYFNKNIMKVKPTDFIELDYYRKLEYINKIEISEEVVEYKRN